MARKQNIKHGSIVHIADCPDPDGKPAGPHFAVVLNSQESIDAGEDLLLSVITKNFRLPLDDGWFLLKDYTPGKPGGHEKTGLTHLSVVKGTWLVILPKRTVTHRGKRAPADIVRQLRAWVKQNWRQYLLRREGKKREEEKEEGGETDQNE